MNEKFIPKALKLTIDRDVNPTAQSKEWLTNDSVQIEEKGMFLIYSVQPYL